MQNNFSSNKYTMIVVFLLAQIFHQQIMAQTTDLHTFKGVTEPVNEAILSSSVDGTIKEILVKEGDWVKKGDPLIRLYRKEQELEVALRYKLWKNTISLEAARIKEKNILELYTASKKLFDKSRSISKEELTRLRIQYDQSQLNRLELEIREEQERIQYEIAKENLARRVLNAPKSGVVTKVFFHQGERCKANQNLIKLVNPKVCYFKCNLEERFAGSIAQKKKVQLQIQSGNRMIEKSGEVVFVSPVVDPASGLMKIKVLFHNNDLAIRPGISGNLIIK